VFCETKAVKEVQKQTSKHVGFNGASKRWRKKKKKFFTNTDCRSARVESGLVEQPLPNPCFKTL